MGHPARLLDVAAGPGVHDGAALAAHLEDQVAFDDEDTLVFALVGVGREQLIGLDLALHDREVTAQVVGPERDRHARLDHLAIARSHVQIVSGMGHRVLRLRGRAPVPFGASRGPMSSPCSMSRVS